MMFLLIALGAFAGFMVGEIWLMNYLMGEIRWLAMVAGGFFGAFFALHQRQRARIGLLESRLSALEKTGRREARTAQASPAPASSPSPPPWNRPTNSDENSASPASPTPASAAPPLAAARARPQQGPGVLDALTGKLRGWFVEGNVPVKIGILVSFVGLAALLRYATEQGWLSAPIELRLLAVALVAIAGLIFGWRQRRARAVFGLSLQGGAIGVLLLTIFAAFALYGILPASAAFGLMAILVGGCGIMAVAQGSQALAVLGIIAGFAAPILVGGEEGNHVALFSWYALLNLAIFGVAWTQAWPMLNRVGFVFTFVIGCFWGVLNYQPAHYFSTQAFLLLFSLLYLLIPMFNAWRSGRDQQLRLDATLVFGLPLLAFPLQIGLLDGARLSIALAALIAALVYLLTAAILLRRLQLPALGKAHAVLALGFATVAVPFAFSGPTIVLIWALQGAVLVWFGCDRQRRLPRLVGLALQLVAAGIWLITAVAPWGSAGLALVNPHFLGGLALALAGAISAWRYHLAAARPVQVNLFAVWAIGLWTLNGLLEIHAQLASRWQMDALVAYLAVTALLSAAAHRRHAWVTTGLAPALMIAAAGLLVFEQQARHVWPLAGWGLAAWIVALAAIWMVDLMLRDARPRWRDLATVAGHGAAVIMLAASGLYLAGTVWTLGEGWRWLATALPLLALIAWLLTNRRPPLCARELSLPGHERLLTCACLGLALGLVVSLTAHGSALPLRFIPVLNPLELAQLLGLGMLLIACRRPHRPSWMPSLGLCAAIGFALLSAMAFRAAHHLGGVPWELTTLLGSGLAQTSLSVVWTILAVAAWVIGSRQRHSALWWVGAILLGIVLVKLVLIDRLFLTTVAGIVSFLAFGLLSIMVGFLAPAPPTALKSSAHRRTGDDRQPPVSQQEKAPE